jgi:hypothetical protein
VSDATGLVLNVKTPRPFGITYWFEAPVNELRIVDVQSVR